MPPAHLTSFTRLVTNIACHGVLLCCVFILTACQLFVKSSVEPFTCEAGPAYTQAGVVDTNKYTVTRQCLRGIQRRIDACYNEAR
jgi:hypothetical protein